MKVIDLINDIANNGISDDIKHIKFYNRNYEENDICLLSLENLIYKLNIGALDINDEIEIIEDKKIEKIGTINYCENPVEMILHHKIDEIIDIISEMREDK